MEHRAQGINLIRGHGLEIGAMHNPTSIPQGCTAVYLDAMTRAQAMETFKEVDPAQFRIEPEYIGDLDHDGLAQFSDEQFDFVILNHVIEHVANPIHVVSELFRIVRKGGHVVLSCPDKRFTFDKDRNLTPFEHLLDEYRNGVTEVTDDHYLDFLRHVHPEVMALPLADLQPHVENVRRRREHAHVWDSDSFRRFLIRSLALWQMDATCVCEVDGDANQFEYFSVWQRN
jgi:SAM-dependent methyltransferase